MASDEKVAIDIYEVVAYDQGFSDGMARTLIKRMYTRSGYKQAYDAGWNAGLEQSMRTEMLVQGELFNAGSE